MSEGRGLKRSLGLAAITIYAVGDILGAGIYALVGEVATMAKSAAWISFALAATIALLTGLSYAELCARYPVAAGAAAYCRRAFAFPSIAFVVGIFVLASGLSSAATVSHAFVGYLSSFVDLPPLAASLGLLVVVSALNYLGIEESSRVNVVLTLVELAGLIFVVAVGVYYLGGVPAADSVARIAPQADLAGITGGATVAFFAYIGFEDTVNMAEEVRQPERSLPRAILVAIVFTTLVYAAVMMVALMVVPLERLAGSEAPLLEVVEAAGIRLPPQVFAAVALLAICNTGLINLIMASRLSYGMAREGMLPAVLTRVDARRRTPWVAVVAAFVLAALLSLSGQVKVLAQTTSLLLLSVFLVLHVALTVIKRRTPSPTGAFATPRWTPWLGALLCFAMLFRYPAAVYLRALVVLAVALGLYFVVGRRGAAGAA
jgi:amino acid transporter